MTAKNWGIFSVAENVVSLFPSPNPPPTISAPTAVRSPKMAPIINPTMIIGSAIGTRIFRKIWKVEAPKDPLTLLCEATDNVTLSADELLRRYCTLAFEKYGSYEAAAERLGMDRRTLRKRVKAD